MSTRTRMRLTYDREALQGVCRRYHITELSFFGSVLRDDFTSESDVDVLIRLAPDTPAMGLKYFHIKRDLEDEVFHRPVDVVQVHLLSRYIADEVMADREIAYEA